MKHNTVKIMWLCDEMQLRLVWSLSDFGMNVQSVDSGASEAGSVGGRFVNHSSINASLASIHLCTPVRGECARGLHLRETIAGIGGGFSSLRTLTHELNALQNFQCTFASAWTRY